MIRICLDIHNGENSAEVGFLSLAFYSRRTIFADFSYPLISQGILYLSTRVTLRH